MKWSYIEKQIKGVSREPVFKLQKFEQTNFRNSLPFPLMCEYIGFWKHIFSIDIFFQSWVAGWGRA